MSGLHNHRVRLPWGLTVVSLRRFIELEHKEELLTEYQHFLRAVRALRPLQRKVYIPGSTATEEEKARMGQLAREVDRRAHCLACARWQAPLAEMPGDDAKAKEEKAEDGNA